MGAEIRLWGRWIADKRADEYITSRRDGWRFVRIVAMVEPEAAAGVYGVG
jgi:hypothetical protein